MNFKKEKELKDLKSFLQTNAFNVSEIECSEGPDFNVLLNGVCIGIEITEYVSSKTVANKIRSVQSVLNSICVEVTRLISEKCIQSITLNFSIRKPILSTINSYERKKIIELLLNYIEHPEVIKLMKEKTFRREFFIEEGQNKFIESVRVSRSAKFSDVHVSKNDEYWSGEMPIKLLESIIAHKEGLIDFSRNTYNWLIIILAETEDSNAAFLQETAKKGYNSIFDKIFLFRREQKDTYELSLNN